MSHCQSCQLAAGPLCCRKSPSPSLHCRKSSNAPTALGMLPVGPPTPLICNRGQPSQRAITECLLLPRSVPRQRHRGGSARERWRLSPPWHPPWALSQLHEPGTEGACETCKLVFLGGERMRVRVLVRPGHCREPEQSIHWLGPFQPSLLFPSKCLPAAGSPSIFPKPGCKPWCIATKQPVFRSPKSGRLASHDLRLMVCPQWMHLIKNP